MVALAREIHLESHAALSPLDAPARSSCGARSCPPSLNLSRTAAQCQRRDRARRLLCNVPTSMLRPTKRVAAALAAAAAILAVAVAAADQTAPGAAAPPTLSKPAAAAVQARAQLEVLATRYYMVIPGSSRPAT
jgi:hypothetical protein